MQGKLEQYRIFKAVADAKSLSTAAKNLYVSQSAISQSIKQLEESLGVRLFSRSQKGVTLTKDGDMLLNYVSTALSQIEIAEKKINEAKELIHGELVIGASNTLTDMYLLPYLHKFHKLYPGVKVRILNGTSKRVLDYLDTGVVDIAFITSNELPQNYNSVLCFKTHTAFVASSDYEIDFNHTFTLQELSSLPLILLEKGAGSRHFLEDCFLKAGIRLEPEIELASYELLISLSKIGLGVAAITEELSSEALSQGLVKKLKVDYIFPERTVSMLTLPQLAPSQAVSRFASLFATKK